MHSLADFISVYVDSLFGKPQRAYPRGKKVYLGCIAIVSIPKLRTHQKTQIANSNASFIAESGAASSEVVARDHLRSAIFSASCLMRLYQSWRSRS